MDTTPYVCAPGIFYQRLWAAIAKGKSQKSEKTWLVYKNKETEQNRIWVQVSASWNKCQCTSCQKKRMKRGTCLSCRRIRPDIRLLAPFGRNNTRRTCSSGEPSRKGQTKAKQLFVSPFKCLCRKEKSWWRKKEEEEGTHIPRLELINDAFQERRLDWCCDEWFG